MAVPHDLYVRYLVTAGCDSVTEVNKRLAELSIPLIGHSAFAAQYDFVESSVPPTVMKQISKRIYEPKFLKWMNTLGIGDIWCANGPWAKKEVTAGWKLIMGLFADKRLTLTMNALMVKVADDNEVAEIISARFSAMLNKTHVSLYRKYFFDSRRMTRECWRSFLQYCSPEEKNLYFIALTENVDVLKTELELPANVSISSALQFLFTKSFQKAKQYLNVPTPEGDKAARAWISQTMALADKYEKYKTGDKADFSKQLLMEFDYVHEDIPAPDDDMLLAIMDGAQKKADG